MSGLRKISILAASLFLSGADEKSTCFDAAFLITERETLNSPVEVLKLGWTTLDIARYNTAITSTTTTDDMTEFDAALRNPAQLTKLRSDLAKVTEATRNLNQAESYDQYNQRMAEASRLVLHYLRAAGVSTVASLSEDRKHGGTYNNIIISLHGESDLNRLARVLFDRFSLLIEIGQRPKLTLDEKSGRITIPMSHLTADGRLQHSIDRIIAFIMKNKSSLKLRPREEFSRRNLKWVDKQANLVDFRKYMGEPIEISYGLPGFVDAIDLRAAKISLVGTVIQSVSDLPAYISTFNKELRAQLTEALNKDVDISTDMFSSDAFTSDFHATIRIVGHTNFKVSDFLMLSGSKEQRRVAFNEARGAINDIADALSEAHVGHAATIMLVQSNTQPIPIDPKSLTDVRRILDAWRQNDNSLSRLSPERVAVHLVNIWVDPDHSKPVVFHRKLNLFSSDGMPTTILDED